MMLNNRLLRIGPVLLMLFFYVLPYITVHAQVHSKNLQQLVSNSAGHASMVKSKVFNTDVLLFKPATSGESLPIIGSDEAVDWSQYNYLVLDVFHHGPYSGIVYIDFYKKGTAADRVIVQQGGQQNKAQITPKIGVMPMLRTQVIFPLSYLDGQHIFMERFPRQLKGTVLGRRLDVDDIGNVAIRIDPVKAPDFTPQLEIASIKLTRDLPPRLPETNPVVDEFGQWTARTWPGKIVSAPELKQKLTSLHKATKGIEFSSDLSKYGGWKKKKFEAKGFFYTHHDGTRWWLVDPDGYAFISTGFDGVRPSAPGLVEGNEDLFKWIPADDSPFKEAVTRKDGAKMVDFLQTNLMKVFGNEWQNYWQDIALGVMKQNSINTIANWSDTNLTSKGKMPYVVPMRGFPSTDVKLFRDFPDVFDSRYREQARQFALQLEPVKNDPFLIGYFLSNEPHWAFGEHYLAFEMFATNKSSFSKKQFVLWLKEKYGSVDKFNSAWNMQLLSVDELESKAIKEVSAVSPQAFEDMKYFSGVLVDEYIRVVCEEVKKIDPNHLNLGLRYAWISSELCYRAGAFFDVFSINGYSYPGPPETAEIARRSGKPVMIGEYHFGAIDRGLPANGIQGAMNQKERGEAYRYYLENGFARPEVIGMHYFQWNDQPILGRFDGENYNIGLFDICYQPYTELLNEVKAAHENMYKVAVGEKKPYANVIKRFPAIFY